MGIYNESCHDQSGADYQAGNRVLTVGDAFDPLEGVTAEDAEEGTIPMTERISKNRMLTEQRRGSICGFVVSDKQAR